MKLRSIMRQLGFVLLCVSVCSGLTEEELREFNLTTDKRAFFLARTNSPLEGVLFSVATELGNYGDEECIRALTQLTKYKQRDTEGLDSIAAAAQRSLDRIESTPDLTKLSNLSSVSDRMELAKRLAEGTNEYARPIVLKHLVKEAEEHPAEVVPVLVVFYANERQTKQLARQYPALFEAEVPEGLRSKNSDVVVGCIDLIGELNLDSHLPALVPFLHLDRESSADIKIRMAAARAFVAFGDKSLPAIETVLNEATDKLDQIDAVSVLFQIGSPKARKVLEEFQINYMRHNPKADDPMVESLTYAFSNWKSKP